MPMLARLPRRTSAIKIEKVVSLAYLIIGAAKLPFSALTAAISVSLMHMLPESSCVSDIQVELTPNDGNLRIHARTVRMKYFPMPSAAQHTVETSLSVRLFGQKNSGWTSKSVRLSSGSSLQLVQEGLT